MPDTPPPVPTQPAGWAALPGRSALRIGGADGVRFIDNFTTAAVSNLAPGSGTEGFFTDARGHVLAVVNILRSTDGLLLDAAPGLAEPLRAHLDHYLIRERVEIADVSDTESALLLAGPAAREWLAARAGGDVPSRELDHARIDAAGIAAHAVALDWFGPGGLLLRVARADAGRLAAWLRAQGLPELDAAAIDAARIEAASPEPIDIDPRTLPQELGRDARAISFTKGCYLGQETVARIDALGHVNRRLVVLAGAEPPTPGAAVTAGGETVGTITSACASPRHGCGIGLALVHVRGLGGAALEVGGAPVRVVPPTVASGSAT